QPPTPTPSGPLVPVATWGQGIPLDSAYLPDGQSVAVLRPAALELRATSRLADIRWQIALATLPTAIACTPDGQIIAVTAADTVALHASNDGALIGVIPGLGAAIADIAISPDGRLLAIAQQDQVISLWDIAERSVLSELRLPQSDEDMIVPGIFTSVAFSPDGQFIAAGDDGGNVAVWAIADGVALQTLSVGLRIVADVAFSPDSTAVAAASEGWRSEPGSIWIWDVASGADLHWLSIDDGARFLAPAERLAFTRDGSQVLMGLADGAMLRWSLANASLIQDLPGHSAAITALAISPDGTGILSASRDGSLRTWRADGAPAESLVGQGAIAALTISPDGTLVISSDEGGAIDIRQPDGAPVAHIPSQGSPITDLAISPDSATLASASRDGTIRLWGIPGGQPTSELHGHSAGGIALAFSPSGTRLASTGGDGSIRLWRVPEGVEERAIADQDIDPALYDIAFSPDGQIIAVAENGGGISLWRSSDITLVERRPIDGAVAIYQVAFTASGGILARAYGGQLFTWDSPGAAAPILSPDIIDLATLPNGDLATLSGDALQIWRGTAGARQPYASAAAPGFSNLAAGPGLIALSSHLGSISVWAVR
ncbi:hypothetical protein EKD04_001500, partial [Chloroflexales bacterium ZM16-3]|nr:hypothetical protein [Chloroflexales bacterium ZM16-3]